MKIISYDYIFMEKSNKLSSKLCPIIVAIVGLIISCITYTDKIRGIIEFFEHSLISLMIILERKIYHKS